MLDLVVNSEDVKFNYNHIPLKILKYNNLDNIVNNGYIYTKINKPWYELKQSDKTAHGIT